MRYSILLILSLLLALNAVAEPTRGRLPDGRAYRIDAAGNELVDYIAELEVTNDALKQRILGLEDEVTEKNAEIERLRESGGTDISIEEKTLSLGMSKSDQAEIERLRSDNQELLHENNKLAAALDGNLGSGKQLGIVKAENTALNNQVSSLQQKLEACSPGQTASQPAYGSSARARMKTQPSEELSGLRKNIEEVDRLVGQRDKDFETYLASGASIGLSPSEPVSKRGMSLKAIKYRIKSPVSASEASRLQTDLKEIRKLMKEDIALIKRLSSL